MFAKGEQQDMGATRLRDTQGFGLENQRNVRLPTRPIRSGPDSEIRAREEGLAWPGTGDVARLEQAGADPMAIATTNPVPRSQ